MSAITDNLADIGSGLLITLVISVLSYAGGLVLGSLMAIFRVGPIPPLRALATAWVTVACNIPNLCLMVLIGLALPNVGIRIPLFWSVIVALVFSSSGFVCETVRSGINSVPKGQIEAARALGMPFWLIIRGIVLPQSLARTLPATGQYLHRLPHRLLARCGGRRRRADGRHTADQPGASGRGHHLPHFRSDLPGNRLRRHEARRTS